MAKLEIQNLVKQYRSDVIPVNNISLSVEDGEFLTLLGPSGCGKSTLLRLIAGLETATKGKVIIGNRNVNNIAPGERNIAMVFQSYALYPHMNAADNITTALKLKKMPPEEINRRLTQAATTLELTNLLDRKPGKMSGGQRQRVALARALVRDPEVFLLDEPLSNLDALLREQVRSQMKQLFKSQNKPVVYVTHDQTEAMTLSSRVAVLYRGEVQQLDTPSWIYSHPANEFVASFVGSPQMNLFTLKRQDNSVKLGGNTIAFKSDDYERERVILGIRPEHIHLANSEDSDVVTGKITLIEELGKEKLVSIQINNSDLIIRALFSLDNLQEGDTINIALASKFLHWFDVSTGKRINNSI
ncbi:MAG: ATP-binding cassette domain-containing protein [Xenococcaceae cyanobacterium MO_188.B19]|nr:ATP-binding cassette domain-containing protein [Xenococcaceae cyanobacterium MO_188.B19]